MRGQMMETPLELNLVRRRAESLFRERAVVTNTVDGPVRATLGDVLDRAARLAHALSALGIGRGDRVATLAWNHQRHVEAYVAVPCMGAVLHTLNLRLAPAQVAYAANDGGARVILADAFLGPLLEAIRPQLTVAERIVTMPADYEDLLAGAPPDPYPWPELDEGDAAAMCHTSGTTGDPKGIVYSHRSTVLHAFALMFADNAGLSASDVVLPVVPQFHANAWGLIHAALAAGSALVLPGPLLAPGQLAELIEHERVTLAGAVPTIWLGLAEELLARPRDLSALRRVLCGGSAVPELLMRRFDQLAPGVLRHAWGMTETSPIGTVATLPPEADGQGWDDDRRLRYRLTQGRPVVGVEIRLIALDGGEAPFDGETLGEVAIRGPWIAASYLGGHDQERFADGWFRTGDIAVGTPEGAIRIVDRSKDVIKSGGEWISSVELEGILLDHPAIREAAVVARPDERWIERPVACVALRAGQPLTLAELRGWLEPRVARFWLPDDLVVLEELPKTSVGKLDKKVMRAAYVAPAPVGGTAASPDLPRR